MDKVQITHEFDENNIRSFLDDVIYKKFNLYPGINDCQVRKYLFELVESSRKTGKLFIAHADGKIIALSIVKELDWDSQHFGYKCAKIDYVLVNQTADIQIRKQALDLLVISVENDALNRNITFMSVSIDSWDAITSYTLQSHNFKYILTWLDGIHISKSKLKLYYPEHEIGLIKDSEVEVYKTLASNNYFKGGRFYTDPYIDDSAVDQMYAKLIISSYENNDILLSYRVNNEPVGLFICKKIVTYKHFNNLNVAHLRYFVIDPKIRQKQIGYDVFAATLNYLMNRCDVISTGLEVHNLPSLNLHKKLNFKFNYTHNAFHWWAK